jgi:hypothetical protein
MLATRMKALLSAVAASFSSSSGRMLQQQSGSMPESSEVWRGGGLGVLRTLGRAENGRAVGFLLSAAGSTVTSSGADRVDTGSASRTVVMQVEVVRTAVDSSPSCESVGESVYIKKPNCRLYFTLTITGLLYRVKRVNSPTE